MPPSSSCPSPTCWWQMRASGLLLGWQRWLGPYFVWFFCLFVFLWAMLLSEIPKLPTDTPVRRFPIVWKFLFLHDSLPRTGLPPCLFCLSFCFLYSILPPFKENGLPLCSPGVLCQGSEVVLWKLLSIQMTFRWICGGETGLPILFLHHLGTIPNVKFLEI